MSVVTACVCLWLSSSPSAHVPPAEPVDQAADEILRWTELAAPFPGGVGVAGPFAGMHNGALIVAGGANFPRPVWENDKLWHDAIYVLSSAHETQPLAWSRHGRLPRPIAYGCSVSTADGVLCIGGNDADSTFRDVFLLSWDPANRSLNRRAYPSLPRPVAFAGAALIADTVYLAAGQTGSALETATNDVWALNLKDGASGKWRRVAPLPGPTRAFPLVAAQHNGQANALYVMSGRRQNGERVEFLDDVWEYTPATNSWRERHRMPQCMMAGTSVHFGRSKIFVLGGADGSLFGQADALRDRHPGFPKVAYVYDTVTNTWSSAGTTPANHVTTIAVRDGSSILIPSGEIRPRVRSTKVWRVTPQAGQ